MSWGAFFIRQLQRESLLTLRQIRLYLNGFLFFLMFIVFFPLALKPEAILLRTMISGIAWMAILIACLLATDRLFDQDYEHGIIEQWMVSGYPLVLVIIPRIMIQIVMNIIPIVCISPCIAFLYGLSFYETAILVISLIAAMPTIISFCTLAAVLSAGLYQRGIYMALIILPLILPVLIFGSDALNRAMQGFPVSACLALLIAFSLLSLVFLPFAITAIMHLTMKDSL